ncbi:regulator of telomere elongation helicase 1-like [Polyodon spathula]|uniref:regulator of telomere elongation helicase 1-like n=1 Tax=Polyodon spathula TaxID=7913 RepID=UPI001B7D9EB0|nr:regulator of telomere elongation helicase 1-like [Polyodon spathula]
MPTIELNGITVDFPFTPYQCQEDYMSKVITCLQNKVNGVLESPTGTGKTLCLLCSTLAWRDHFKDTISARKISEMGGAELFPDRPMSSWGNSATDGETSAYYTDIPKIIYASRTHSQLSHVINELKNTSYRPKMCVLGSREQLCINPEVKKQTSNHMKIHLCRAKLASHSCQYYNNIDEKSTEKDLVNTILDVEDLVKNGNKHRVCPYYLSRSMKQQADIIFMPYNYLLDLKSRRVHNIELNGAVIIFDEAHNVEKMCEDSASFDLTPYDIATAIEAVNQVLSERAKRVGPSDEEFHMEAAVSGLKMDVVDIAKIKMILLDLEAAIDSIDLPANGKGVTKPGSFIFELFKKAHLTFETKSGVLEAVETIIGYLSAFCFVFCFFCFFFVDNGIFINTLGLQKLSDVIEIVFSSYPTDGSIVALEQNIGQHYKVHIQPDNSNQKRKQNTDIWSASATKKKGKILSYWCFSPGFSMNELVRRGVRSIILTSGTLSPLSSFTSEMQIEFPVTLENPHVIDKHQIFVGIVPKGPDGIQLSSAYDKRFTPDYMASLGKTVTNVGRVVPHGLLVFFSSYPVMDKTIEYWKDNGHGSTIEGVKPMFVEPRNKGEFTEVMDSYYAKVSDPKASGASFFAVCRGKASEGLDFSDTNGRAVIITGLPFPPRMDPKIILKMQFLDEMRRKATGGVKFLSGQEWYRQQASRAVNQAIGRVIRHRHDFGAIFLCDHRFMNTDARAQLPSWVRPFVKVYDNFGHIIRDVSQFFRVAQKIMPPPKSKFSAYCDAVCSAEDSSSGCLSSGGSFSPGGNSFVRKDKMLDSHVPSFKKRRLDTGLHSDGDVLCIEYETDMDSVRRKPVGLLDALEHNDKPGQEAEKLVGEEKAGRLSTLSLQHDKRLEDEQRGFRKKIKLVHDWKNEVPASEQTKAEKAKLFMAAVRKSLSQTNSDQFTQAMQKYKKTDDFEAMVADLAALFTGDPNKHYLLRDFYQFVRPHHKKQFHEACCELTGEGCGYKSEHSLSKEEKEKLMETAVLAEKKTKMEIPTASANSFISSASSSSQLNTSQQLNKGGSHLNTEKLTKVESHLPVQLVSKEMNMSAPQKLCLEVYLEDVKRALGPTKYKQFYVAIQAYKRTDNYDNMVSETVALFTEKTEDFELLRRFSMFVRPYHKQQFIQMSKELTGTAEETRQDQKEEKPSCQDDSSAHSETSRDQSVVSKTGEAVKAQSNITSFFMKGDNTK